MPVAEAAFGECDGLKAKLFTLTNGGVSVSVTDYGATLTHLVLPGKGGAIADVLLGFDDLAGYRRADNPYFGATIGRVANRIGSGASFSVDGEKFNVTANHADGTAMLHGGNKGFDKVIWESAIEDVPGRPATVYFTYVSPDGEEGFPGECRTVVTYSLSDQGELRLGMESTVDKACVVNLCNHAYFNLKGHGSGDVLGHKVHINADQFTPSGGDSIPTGELAAVAGTSYDFSASGEKMRTIGEKIGEMHDVPGSGGGYDHNYVLRTAGFGKLSHAATVLEPDSGRKLDLWTSAPGMQLYTANYLPPGPDPAGDPTPVPGKAGQAYNRFGAFCLETQHFPDSANKPNFPSILLRPGEVYSHHMLFRFSVVD